MSKSFERLSDYMTHVSKTYRLTALYIGCGMAGRSELCVSKHKHTLPASPPLFMPQHNGAPLLCGALLDEIPAIPFFKQITGYLSSYYLASCNAGVLIFVSIIMNFNLISFFGFFVTPRNRVGF